MNAPLPIHPATYTYRTIDCPDCWEGKIEKTVESGLYGAGGYYSEDCDECGGTGELEATCAECGEENPLNDDGVCEGCTLLCEVRSDPFLGRLGNE